MRKNLLELIRCPNCYQKVRTFVKLETETEIIEGILFCEICGIEYPVVEGVPFLTLINRSWRPILKELIVRRYIHQNYLSHFTEKTLSEVEEKQAQEHLAELQCMFEKALQTKLGMLDLSHLKICDVGAGECDTTLKIAAQGAYIIGVDPEFSHLKKAGYKITKNTYFDRVVADGHRLPFAEASFDITFCRATLHHTKNLQGVINEMARITRPKGKLLIISEPVRALGDSSYNYYRDSRDYQLGLNEEAPLYLKYWKALRKYVHNIEVDTGTTRLGDRVAKYLERISPRFLIFKQPQIISGLHQWKMFFLKGAINIYAVRNSKKCQPPPPLSKEDIICDNNIFADIFRRTNLMSNILNKNFLEDTEILARLQRKTLDTSRLTSKIDFGKKNLYMLNYGFYEPEKIYNQKARFTAQYASFWLKIEESKAAKHIVLSVFAPVKTSKFMFSSPYEIIEGEVIVNGTSIGKFNLDKYEWRVLKYPLDSLSEEVLEIRIITNQIWIPDETLHNGDKRVLGVALKKIEII